MSRFDEERESHAAPDLEQRILCLDGSCIGVIGGDGTCKECGMPYVPPTAAAPVVAAHDSATENSIESFAEDTSPLDLENRELCADGACIGIIGPVGRCTVCRRTPDEARQLS